MKRLYYLLWLLAFVSSIAVIKLLISAVAQFLPAPAHNTSTRVKTLPADECLQISYDKQGNISVYIYHQEYPCDFQWVPMLQSLSAYSKTLVRLEFQENASSQSTIDDAAMNEIAAFHELTELNMSGVFASVTAFDCLSRLTKLKSFYIQLNERAEVTVDLVRCIRSFPALKCLSFAGSRFAPGALHELATIQRPICLDCSNCELDDGDLMILTGIPSLRKLVIKSDVPFASSEITEDGVRRLRAARPDVATYIDIVGREGHVNERLETVCD